MPRSAKRGLLGSGWRQITSCSTAWKTSSAACDRPRTGPANPIRSDKLANNPNQIVAFSSRGPTLDGRIKPDVVAPGTYVLSTRSRRIASNNFGYGRYQNSTLYMFDSGTSMSTPLTAGAVGLIRQLIRKLGIANPS